MTSDPLKEQIYGHNQWELTFAFAGVCFGYHKFSFNRGVVKWLQILAADAVGTWGEGV